jgi:hypothetical protein
VVRDYVDGSLEGLVREDDDDRDITERPDSWKGSRRESNATSTSSATLQTRRRTVVICASLGKLDELLSTDDLIFTIESASRATLCRKQGSVGAAAEGDGDGKGEAAVTPA